MESLVPLVAPAAVAYFLVFNPLYINAELIVASIVAFFSAFLMENYGTLIHQKLGCYSRRGRWLSGFALLAIVVAYYYNCPVDGDYPVHSILVVVQPSSKASQFRVILRDTARLPFNCFHPTIPSIVPLDEEDMVPRSLTFHADRICVDTGKLEEEPFHLTLVVEVTCNGGMYSLRRQLKYTQDLADRFHKSVHASVQVTPRCVRFLESPCEPIAIAPRASC
jgi:hypothetical protein